MTQHVNDTNTMVGALCRAESCRFPVCSCELSMHTVIKRLRAYRAGTMPSVETLAQKFWEADGPVYRGWPNIGQRVQWCYSDQHPAERARCFALAQLAIVALSPKGSSEPGAGARLIDRDEVWRLFVEHYWDSFQKDRDLILCHVDAVLCMTPASTEPTNAMASERK